MEDLIEQQMALDNHLKQKIAAAEAAEIVTARNFTLESTETIRTKQPVFETVRMPKKWFPISLRGIIEPFLRRKSDSKIVGITK